jgi:hypothetical protein
MDLIVGIDFTGSNGNPDFPTSLHYVDPTEKTLNQYEQAILSVGSILEPYDTDHFHHVFGYGAKLPLLGEQSGSYSKVQHCFPLLDEGNAVYGIDGILRVSLFFYCTQKKSFSQFCTCRHIVLRLMT